ncbi:putative RNA polymerase-associated protein RTF1 [Triangularia verruculosa]|uniref:RNA polymerase-associated protein RTF1 n=1 Tax=Triangularia verruculosa TaxID=2587418 RepID=A0AAN6X893_9PEZI|nr:putative RNA polymerase-associated protein RTF1 [Triangularia verruculosa]
MSDVESLDDELLALAGGDEYSDSEDDQPRNRSRNRSRTTSPAPGSSRNNDASGRGVAVKRTPGSKGRRRSRSDDESEDEGEASPPGSPGSQGSASMDDSDSDSDAAPTQARGGDDDAVQYPVEGLFKSQEEKARIMGMREIEREQILAERREENERIRQNRMLRQLKVNQEKDNKKRKASAADLEDELRKPSRARTKAGEISEKMDTLRRAREERSSRREQRERDMDRRKQRSPSYRDRSRSPDDRDSDAGDWRRGSRQKSRSPEKEILPADLRDVERVRVGRSRFAEVCFYPGFEQAITGCFVRINIGPDQATRQDVYRMAIIKGFNTGRPYAMPDSSGHQMVVDLYVKVAHGDAVREWPFISCSDRGFTESEWNRYKQVCLTAGINIPTKNQLVAKISDINGLVRHKWTEQEIADKLKRQNTLMAKFSNTERDNLTRQLEAARVRGDEDAVDSIQKKLEDLSTPKLAFRTSLASERRGEGKGMTQQERLAVLNAENRRRNAEEVRKAQLKERERRIIPKGRSAADTPSGSQGGGGGESQREGSGGGNTPAANGGGGGLLPHIAKLQEQQRAAAAAAKNGLPLVHAPLMDDDIIGALDLGIDVEID